MDNSLVVIIVAAVMIPSIIEVITVPFIKEGIILMDKNPFPIKRICIF